MSEADSFSDGPLPAAPIGAPVVLLSLTCALAGWLLQSHMPLADASPPTRFSLQEAASSTKVAVRRGSQESPCPFDAGSRRWVCAKDAFAFVGPYAGIAAGEVLSGWWLHPMAGATTVARLQVPCKGELHARFGLVDDAPAGSKLEARLFAADKPVGNVSVSGPLQNGTLQAVLDQGATCELRIEVSAPDHAWRMGVLDLTIDPVEGGKP